MTFNISYIFYRKGSVLVHPVRRLVSNTVYKTPREE